MIELNLSEFGGLEWDCFVPMPHDKEELKDISELMAIRGSRSAIMHKGKELKIDDLIPDLTFPKFTGSRLDYSEINILVSPLRDHKILTATQSTLDKGGFSNVYKGLITLNGKIREVAVKELIFTTIATKKEKLKIFYDFRHEVLVQGQLKHPNICQILGTQVLTSTSHT